MARRRRVLVAWLIVAGVAMGERAWAEEKGAANKEAKAEAKAEPASEKGAKTEASKDAKKDAPTADGKAKDAKKETKPEAAKDVKEAKAEKGASKSEAKSNAKAEANAASQGGAKTDAKSAAKDDAKTDAKGGAKTDVKKDAKTAQKAGPSKKAGAKPGESSAGTIGEAPANGPMTPPLRLSALRDEMSHPPVRRDEHPATKAEREKLEQLAAEINKAREGLRQDTAKLEAMLAARDAAPPPVASAGTPSNGDSGEPAKKVPTPLDNLSKAIRGMKPEQAAPIISRVDRKLAADILLRMPGADAGKVMGVCKPEVAAELAAEIASRTPRAELRR